MPQPLAKLLDDLRRYVEADHDRKGAYDASLDAALSLARLLPSVHVHQDVAVDKSKLAAASSHHLCKRRWQARRRRGPVPRRPATGILSGEGWSRGRE